jgi:hypothetical protein
MTAGFTRVTPTPEEIRSYEIEHDDFPPAVYRVSCDQCGKRLWGSGLGLGSHRRFHLKQTAAAGRALGFDPRPVKS